MDLLSRSRGPAPVTDDHPRLLGPYDELVRVLRRDQSVVDTARSREGDPAQDQMAAPQIVLTTNRLTT